MRLDVTGESHLLVCQELPGSVWLPRGGGGEEAGGGAARVFSQLERENEGFLLGLLVTRMSFAGSLLGKDIPRRMKHASNVEL